ncbi:MAG: glycine oxidase ThiO [Gammaproteobacteria bacterium]|nr:MAG: glycine oxidase ThiO [Gammaproteobacteria bacterium]
MKSNTLVIGGGIIGLMTARELLSTGQQVTIVDRQYLGREASWAGAGILSPLYPWRYADAVIAMALWSQEQYPKITRELSKNTGVDAEWVRSGLLILEPFSNENAAKCCEKYAIKHEFLLSEQIRELFPYSVNDSNGLWLPDVAQVRNPRLIAALRLDLEKKGCRILEQVSVQSFIEQQGRFIGVETSGGRIEADRCLLTAGAWTAKLLQSTGLALPIYPVRGQMLLLQAKPGLVSHILLQDQKYMVPRSDGHILIGSTLERVGFDKSTTRDALEALQQWAVRHVPLLKDVAIIQQWAGLRPGTDDGVPFIGPHPQMQGLYFCAGHFRNGLVSAPASARILVDMLLQRAPIFDLDPFDMQRRCGTDAGVVHQA